jgi:type III secretory pathway component EscS
VSDPTSIALDALYLALRLSLPALGVAFLVALLIGFVQTLTQLREPVLSAIPRLLGVSLVLLLSASAVGGELVGFASRIYRALPELVQGP